MASAGTARWPRWAPPSASPRWGFSGAWPDGWLRVMGAAAERRWIFAVMATAGASLFAFGYVEAYPALGLLLVASSWRWWPGRTARVRRPGSAGLFGLAVATHASAVLVAPAVAFAFVRRRPRAGLLVLAALAAALPLAVAFLALPAWLPASGFADTGRHWQELFGGFRLYQWGPGAWCLDQLNRWGCAAGCALALIVSSFPGRHRGEDRLPLLGLVALGLMLPALILDTEGFARGAPPTGTPGGGGMAAGGTGRLLAARGPRAGATRLGLPAVALGALLPPPR
jgi:hypothetical protein